MHPLIIKNFRPNIDQLKKSFPNLRSVTATYQMQFFKKASILTNSMRFVRLLLSFTIFTFCCVRTPNDVFAKFVWEIDFLENAHLYASVWLQKPKKRLNLNAKISVRRGLHWMFAEATNSLPNKVVYRLAPFGMVWRTPSFGQELHYIGRWRESVFRP
jgi:hypothetical protein